jgi:hypothetical protein
MELETEWDGKKQYLVLSYTTTEIRKINSRMEELGFETRETDIGFGFDANVEYYRDTKNKFMSIDGQTGLPIVDDINAPVVMNNSTYNIAVFRVVPENGEVRIPLSRYANANDVRNLGKIARVISRDIFGFPSSR